MTSSQTKSEPKPVGRNIYFYHNPSTKLPIRNTDKKNEPYIEYGYEKGENGDGIIGAENYCDECYPDVINQIDKKNEKYLFLVTFPKHNDIEPRENQIVGYIRKKKVLDRVDEPKAIVGEMKLFEFDDAIQCNEYGKRSKGPLGRYGETFDKEQTSEIIAHFESCDDVTKQCLEKTLELKDGDQTEDTSSDGC